MMDTRIGWQLALALAAGWTGVASAALPDAVDGHWYNPAQSGHGLSVELVPGGERAVVIWHTFDLSGEPLTLYVDGKVSGRRISGETYAPRGMPFGTFDPSQLALPVWGEVTLEFADCGHATLSWVATDPGFAAGDTEVQRLANSKQGSCSLPPANPLPAGLYWGDIRNQDQRFLAYAEGVVDKEGRLWAAEHESRFHYLIEATVPAWYRAWSPHVILAEPTAVSELDSGVWNAITTVYPTNGSGDGDAVIRSNGEWSFYPHAMGAFAAPADYPVDGVGEQAWYPADPTRASLIAPIGLPRLQGSYTVFADNPIHRAGGGRAPEGALSIAQDGALCVDLISVDEDLPCDLQGRVSLVDADIGLFDFSLVYPAFPARLPQRGRGWLVNRGGTKELTLVGHNGASGLVLIAR